MRLEGYHKAIMRDLVDRPADECSLFLIGCRIRQPLLPILSADLEDLEHSGAVCSRWDDELKPRRRLYQLTEQGKKAVAALDGIKRFQEA